MRISNITIYLQATLLIIILISCNENINQVSSSKTILIDAEYLENTKSRIEKSDPQLMPAFDQLIEEAEAALKEGPYSVTDKEKLPPSGDLHDYASYSRYWWPDPNQPDGLPYIRRDGETYPGSQSLKESDRQRIGAMGKNSETLALAYYLTGNEKYAEKTAQLLRVWFLDEATRMNPNVNHAQCRPGHNTGTKSGILDGRVMMRALEGSLLISESSALSKNEIQGLKKWATEYFEWLTTNKMALDEAASKNNHGTYYDAQAMYFALFSENHNAAKKIAEAFNEKRILSQVQPDGSMPEEMARTRPLFYSIYNLHAMFLVGHLSKKVGVDVYDVENNNARFRAGLDYLVPYADPSKVWPDPVLKETNRMELFPILHMAKNVYSDGEYLKMTEKLPIENRRSHRINLVLPVMR